MQMTSLFPVPTPTLCWSISLHETRQLLKWLKPLSPIHEIFLLHHLILHDKITIIVILFFGKKTRKYFSSHHLMLHVVLRQFVQHVLSQSVHYGLPAFARGLAAVARLHGQDGLQDAFRCVYVVSVIINHSMMLFDVFMWYL